MDCANTFYIVLRGSALDEYLQWAYPYRNYISEPRLLSSIVADVQFALRNEVNNMYCDDELIMCRNTRFDQIFKISHVLLDYLPTLLLTHLAEAPEAPGVSVSALDIEDDPRNELAALLQACSLGSGTDGSDCGYDSM